MFEAISKYFFGDANKTRLMDLYNEFFQGIELLRSQTLPDLKTTFGDVYKISLKQEFDFSNEHVKTGLVKMYRSNLMKFYDEDSLKGVMTMILDSKPNYGRALICFIYIGKFMQFYDESQQPASKHVVENEISNFSRVRNHADKFCELTEYVLESLKPYL
ncbi:hypothetical protein [Carp edema virus]|nr:hypothetical protein [Carp edema virus]